MDAWGKQGHVTTGPPAHPEPWHQALRGAFTLKQTNLTVTEILWREPTYPHFKDMETEVQGQVSNVLNVSYSQHPNPGVISSKHHCSRLPKPDHSHSGVPGVPRNQTVQGGGK